MITLIHTKNYPIYKQLQLEEALLRVDDRNFCVINEGSEKSAVLGISCKPNEHLNAEVLLQKPIPIIQRFSGGGSVVVDHQTLFISWIFNKKQHPVKPFPEPILQWTKEFYQRAWSLQDFDVLANDYVIGTTKCGGNAQYIQKDRWLHHTTFLWDYEETMMEYLSFPPKVPEYRQKRSHTEFLCKLKDHCSEKAMLIENLKKQLDQEFDVSEVSLDSLIRICEEPHRKATILVGLR